MPNEKYRPCGFGAASPDGGNTRLKALDGELAAMRKAPLPLFLLQK